MTTEIRVDKEVPEYPKYPGIGITLLQRMFVCQCAEMALRLAEDLGYENEAAWRMLQASRRDILHSGDRTPARRWDAWRIYCDAYDAEKVYHEPYDAGQVYHEPYDAGQATAADRVSLAVWLVIRPLCNEGPVLQDIVTATRGLTMICEMLSERYTKDICQFIAERP